MSCGDELRGCAGDRLEGSYVRGQSVESERGKAQLGAATCDLDGHVAGRGEALDVESDNGRLDAQSVRQNRVFVPAQISEKTHHEQADRQEEKRVEVAVRGRNRGACRLHHHSPSAGAAESERQTRSAGDDPTGLFGSSNAPGAKGALRCVAALCGATPPRGSWRAEYRDSTAGPGRDAMTSWSVVRRPAAHRDRRVRCRPASTDVMVRPSRSGVARAR